MDPTSLACSVGAADYVDKILRGTKRADILVEQPMKFDLVINLKTAKSIGSQVPELVLISAMSAFRAKADVVFYDAYVFL